jgi:hypothetical protein
MVTRQFTILDQQPEKSCRVIEVDATEDSMSYY